MTKPKLLVFDSDEDSADMFELYFTSRGFNIEMIMLEDGWVESTIVQNCKIDYPDAIVVHDWDSLKMLSLYKNLRDEIQAENIAIALISVRWPTGYVEVPKYLFVYPYDISSVEAFIDKELDGD